MTNIERVRGGCSASGPVVDLVAMYHKNGNGWNSGMELWKTGMTKTAVFNSEPSASVVYMIRQWSTLFRDYYEVATLENQDRFVAVLDRWLHDYGAC